MPTSHRKQHNTALNFLQSNRLHDALEIYQNICSQSPRDAQAWHMSAVILGMLGDLDAARKHCDQAIKLMPNEHGPYINLGTINMTMGKMDAARKCFEKALQCKPEDTQALSNLGSLYISLGKLTDAKIHLEQALKSQPSSHEAWNNLGIVYMEQGDLTLAEKHFQHALTLNPSFIDALANLGNLCVSKFDFDKAQLYYQRGLALDPLNRALLCRLGKMMQSMGDYDEALKIFTKAMDIYPQDNELAATLAAIYERFGEIEKAISTLRPLLCNDTVSPDAVITYSVISRKTGDQHKAINLLNAMLDDVTRCGDIINLHFALGELHDSLGEYDKAFKHIEQANKLDSRSTTLNPQTELFDSTIDFFSEARMGTLPTSDNTSPLPIFIVGMPRSGTSLIEQILASHRDITAGGERADILNIIDSLSKKISTNKGFPFLLDDICNHDLKQIADDYIQRITKHSGTSIGFTDKTPHHGQYLGFINMILPASRVIICERNPIDTCLSIYFHRFNRYHNYAMDLETLGKYYSGYKKLLDHLFAVLDIQVMRIQYEELVTDSENNIRSIIEFCGLDWDPGCLDFHRNKRIVNTPSYDQVRQPIYQSSIDKWKRYEKYLQPLINAIYE